MIAETLKALNLLLKQSLHGIVVFYAQKTPNTQHPFMKSRKCFP